MHELEKKIISFNHSTVYGACSRGPVREGLIANVNIFTFILNIAEILDKLKGNIQDYG